ncbi:hypothetical protein TNIN_435621 [Trichonephila inaurata madagascariensis]|uniref:Uncharacterized protein n=1 Tax=Trichonephila inaurata madagascariensis TaxID=2747483 RepID=A0A8X7C9R0_9ARAC|nr:hypothetical protein TNIN_435621 [Trichonephila inaurata madagascariensis]
MTEEETPLYVTLYRNKKLYVKEGNPETRECWFQRIRDEMYVLSRKQQNMMKEIKKVKQEWTMDQKLILRAKLNEMKAKYDLIQRKKDILKEENDKLKTKEQDWKTKENEWKTKENELKSKLQGTLRKNKILKRILLGKRADRVSSNPWRWNTRVKRLIRPPSAVSQLSRSLTHLSD